MPSSLFDLSGKVALVSGAAQGMGRTMALALAEAGADLMIATGIFLVCSTIPGQGFGTQMIWLCLTAFGAFFWISPFWTLPSLTLTATAAAVATGLINMGANLAGYAGNHVTGWLRTHGYGEMQCLHFLAACFIAGGAIISFLRLKPKSA